MRYAFSARVQFPPAYPGDIWRLEIFLNAFPAYALGDRTLYALPFALFITRVGTCLGAQQGRLLYYGFGHIDYAFRGCKPAHECIINRRLARALHFWGVAFRHPITRPRVCRTFRARGNGKKSRSSLGLHGFSNKKHNDMNIAE